MSLIMHSRQRLANQVARLDRVSQQLADVARDLRPQLQQAKLAALKLTRGKNGLPEMPAVGNNGRP